MKKLILFALFAASFAVQAQNVTKDKNGNYQAISRTDSIGSSAKKTKQTFTDAKGVIYPVMESKNGLYFVVKTSKKTGKKYNYYLKS